MRKLFFILSIANGHFIRQNFRTIEWADVGQSNNTIACYICAFSKNAGDGSVIMGDEKCRNDITQLPNSIVHLPREGVPPGPYERGTRKVRNVCATLETTMTETVQFKMSPDGPVNKTTLPVYLFERLVWQLYEGSTMWDYEGAADFSFNSYNCGTNVSTCSEAYTNDPQPMFTKDYPNPCGVGCDYLKVRDLQTNELLPVQGNISCTEAISGAAPVCNLKPGPMISENFQGTPGDSGICSVGEVKVSINGHENPDELLQYRYCDSKDSFMEAGFFTVDAPVDSFSMCKTDLCNSAGHFQPGLIYLFATLIYFTTN